MTDQPRHYTIDGKPYPRVSTVLDVLAKPGIEAWRRRVGPAEAERISREATTLGTAVHDALERVALSYAGAALDMSTVADEHAPYMRAFADWLDANVAKVLITERRVVHRTHGYTGTFDLAVVLRDERLAIIDHKTSNSIDALYRLQLSAYADALRDEAEHGTWEAGPVDARLVLRFPSRQGGRALYVHEYPDHAGDLRLWQSALRLYKFQERERDAWKQPGERYESPAMRAAREEDERVTRELWEASDGTVKG